MYKFGQLPTLSFGISGDDSTATFLAAPGVDEMTPATTAAASQP
jgi:hypothetical protein